MVKDKDNIITFPTNRIVKKNTAGIPKSKELIKKIQDQHTKQFVETSVDDISLGLLRQFYNMAIKTNKKSFTKDLAMLVDIMRGLVYRDFDVKHPAQILSEKMVELRINKDGTESARIDYTLFKKLFSNDVGRNGNVKKPLSKDIKNELKDINDQAGLFDGDDIKDD